VSLECWDLEFPDDNDLARDELKRRADAMMPFMPPEQVRAA